MTASQMTLTDLFRGQMFDKLSGGVGSGKKYACIAMLWRSIGITPWARLRSREYLFGSWIGRINMRRAMNLMLRFGATEGG